MTPLLRVRAELDGGCVQKDDRARSVEEAELPKRDDLLFDGCEHDVLMRLMLEADLCMFWSYWWRIDLATARAAVVISEPCWLGRTQMSMPLLTVSFVDHGGR